MPRDSNGNASTDPVYVATPGTTIRAVQHNTPIADIIQMLTGSLARNGTGGMLADLAMGGFKITGLANGTSAQDAVTKAQLDATLDATLDDLPQLGAWTDVASASTVNLGAQASRNLVITGTTTITSFGTAGAADNVPYLIRFAGALMLTNSASLILPGGANITTATGDVATVVHDSASVWRVVDYCAAAVAPAGLASAVWTAGVSTTPAPIDPVALKTVVAAQIAALPITKVYESAQQAIVSGGSVTLAHGLGAPPKLLQIEAICVTAENGFVVGQTLILTGNPAWESASGNRNMFIRSADATSIVLQFGDATAVGRAFTAAGASASLTNAAWRARVRAFA